MSVICPNCLLPAKEEITKYGMRHVCCGLWSWGGKPLVDKETHKARTKAHIAFDALWKSGAMTRTAAYKRLAKHMKLPLEQCHISLFDPNKCEKATRFAEKKRAEMKL